MYTILYEEKWCSGDTLSFPLTHALLEAGSTTAVTSSTQAHLLPSTSSIAAIVSEPRPPIPMSDDMLSTTNCMFIRI
ncbi:hypothetical protein TNCV_4328551 [Trichonephila clavipes]|nr:hypothetical protein TNCV_4328551 [Trichonephila clavipes]